MLYVRMSLSMDTRRQVSLGARRLTTIKATRTQVKSILPINLLGALT